LTDSAASSRLAARFYLCEYRELTPARDDIDFAEGTPPVPGQNVESLYDQESGGAIFGCQRETLLAVGARGRFYRVR
jgi:hypothetical protein